MKSNPPSRPIYNNDQVLQIYDRISLPAKFRYTPGEESRAVAQGQDGLAYLAALQRAMLTAVPFENLELHYSPHKLINLNPDVLFDKIVAQGRGRGGYCMENNTFFGTLLRSSGFRVISTGARANVLSMMGAEPSDTDGASRYSGFGHMVNIVTIIDSRYMVDVGFGSGSSVKPLLLQDGAACVNIAPHQQYRVRWDSIPDYENQQNKVWITERRNTSDGPWSPLLCFPNDLEFLPADFEKMSYASSTMRTSSFTYQVVCIKFILDEAGKDIIGDVVLYKNKVHRRIRGLKEDLDQITTEKDRIEALEKYLGVTLSDVQRNGIRGLVTSLPTGD